MSARIKIIAIWSINLLATIGIILTVFIRFPRNKKLKKVKPIETQQNNAIEIQKPANFNAFVNNLRNVITKTMNDQSEDENFHYAAAMFLYYANSRNTKFFKQMRFELQDNSDPKSVLSVIIFYSLKWQMQQVYGETTQSVVRDIVNLVNFYKPPEKKKNSIFNLLKKTKKDKVKIFFQFTADMGVFGYENPIFVVMNENDETRTQLVFWDQLCNIAVNSKLDLLPENSTFLITNTNQLLDFLLMILKLDGQHDTYIIQDSSENEELMNAIRGWFVLLHNLDTTIIDLDTYVFSYQSCFDAMKQFMYRLYFYCVKQYEDETIIEKRKKKEQEHLKQQLSQMQ